MANKKKFLLVFSGILSATVLSLGVVLATQNPEPEHVQGSNNQWNHYDAVAPTLDDSGIKEYWVNCETHEHQFTAPTGDVEIVDIGDVDFDKNKGIQITTDWLTQYGELDGILGDSDTCALAAIEAYRAAGLNPEDYVFIGLDGGSDACNAILAGELDGSVLQSAEQYAELTLQICADTFTGKIDAASDTDQPSLVIDPVMITPENVGEFVDLYKEYGLM